MERYYDSRRRGRGDEYRNEAGDYRREHNRERAGRPEDLRYRHDDDYRAGSFTGEDFQNEGETGGRRFQDVSERKQNPYGDEPGMYSRQHDVTPSRPDLPYEYDQPSMYHRGSREAFESRRRRLVDERRDSWQPAPHDYGREHSARQMLQPERFRSSGYNEPGTASFASDFPHADSRHEPGGRSGIFSETGPNAGRGPKGYRRSDEHIIEEACQCLERHGYVDASDVEVTCVEGVLTLEGEVPDRRSKREAESAVEDIYGVKDVMNHLRVRKDDKRREDTNVR